MSAKTKQQKWEGILADQSQSGQSKKAYCKNRGINLATFYYWQRRLSAVEQEEQSVVGFSRVHALEAEHELSICLTSGTVHLRSRSIQTLGQLIRELSHA